MENYLPASLVERCLKQRYSGAGTVTFSSYDKLGDAIESAIATATGSKPKLKNDKVGFARLFL